MDPLQYVFEQLPGYIGWKSKELHYLGCNQNLAALLGFKNATQILNLADHDLADHTSESSVFHAQNDFLALAGQVVTGLHKSHSPYNGSLFYFVKKPIINQENEVDGLIYQCQEFVPPSNFSNIFQINSKYSVVDTLPSHYRMTQHHNPFGLSPRELECLFFIMRGKSAKQISELIRLSKRTIEHYTENIKNKFSCEKKADLLVAAVTHGYMNYLPPRFLQMVW